MLTASERDIFFLSSEEQSQGKSQQNLRLPNGVLRCGEDEMSPPPRTSEAGRLSGDCSACREMALHGSRCLYCVVLAMSWWVLGPLPKVANAFLLLLCPTLLEVADPEGLAAKLLFGTVWLFCSESLAADVVEATLLLLLSAADREIRSSLAPWIALRSHAEGMKLRWLFTGVCLGTFRSGYAHLGSSAHRRAICDRRPRTTIPRGMCIRQLLPNVLNKRGALIPLDAHVDNPAFGEPVHFPADVAEHHLAFSPQHSQSGHTTPHRMADHPLNLYSPHLSTRPPTFLKAERPVAGAALSGSKIPLKLTTAPQGLSGRTVGA
ncbi:hypothetical protein MRX96_052685 [Rhipicephalus microplus]